MALFVKQDENRTDLQKRIAADLREKSARKSGGTGGDPGQTEYIGEEADLIEDSAYIEGTKMTTGLAFVWLLVFGAIVLAIIYFLIFA